jgi:hypothetical protein
MPPSPSRVVACFREIVLPKLGRMGRHLFHTVLKGMDMTQTQLTQTEAAEANALYLRLCNVLHGVQTRVILSGLAMTMLHFMLGEQQSGTDAVDLLDEFHRKVRSLLVSSISTAQADTEHFLNDLHPPVRERRN